MSDRVNPDRNARRIFRPVAAKLLAAKSDDTSPGWIEGYAATWGNVDLQGEMMLRGCFARSIDQVVPARKVKLMAVHFAYGGDAIECIGTVTQAKEDDYGLWIHAELSSVQLAQDIRTKIIEGHINSLSVGFRPVQWDYRQTNDPAAQGNEVAAYLECKLAEVTVTVKPVNELAEITAAKSQQPNSKPAAKDTGKSEPGDAATAVVATTPRPPVTPRMRREIELAKAFLETLRR